MWCAVGAGGRLQSTGWIAEGGGGKGEVCMWRVLQPAPAFTPQVIAACCRPGLPFTHPSQPNPPPPPPH
jgi:hypothetical protein